MKLKTIAAYLSLLLVSGMILLACKKYYITEVTEVITVDPPADTTLPHFIEFGFLADDNPLYLNDSLSLDISRDAITGRVPYYTNIKSLAPFFKVNDGLVTVDGVEQLSGETKQDFSKEVVYKVTNESGGTKEFTVRLINFTGLPVVRINTEGSEAITTKDTYINATMRIDGAGKFDDYEGGIRIRGRGNSTWGMPKKPYRVKLDNKVSLFGKSAHKDWVMLANYSDKTLLRIHTALYMGNHISNLGWTSSSEFVDVFLNEIYIGTYEFAEKIEVDKERVNITKQGFLLEADQESRMTAQDVWFKTDRILLCIKEPKVVEGDEQYNYIKNFLTTAENILYSSDFNDPENGYKKYFDIQSFVDWYLINEITKNRDAIFFSSCYMNVAPNEKIKMGPIWDFDIAFGNDDFAHIRQPEGFYIKNSVWIKRMFDDPEFVSLVKERFTYFNSRRTDIMKKINSTSAMLKWSIVENNNKWKNLYVQTWPNYAVWGSYDNEIVYMKNWLNARMDWLAKEMQALPDT